MGIYSIYKNQFRRIFDYRREALEKPFGRP